MPGSHDAVLHVCGGQARHYPYKGRIRPQTTRPWISTRPPNLTYLQDAASALPRPGHHCGSAVQQGRRALHPRPRSMPQPSRIVARAIEALPIGGRVGIIRHILPSARRTRNSWPPWDPLRLQQSDSGLPSVFGRVA